jgi:hypothetical protein
LVGITLPFLALGIYAVQFQQKLLFVPWYVPILALAGVLAISIALWQRPTVLRVVGLVVVMLLCAGEWTVLSVSKLPSYSGPARAGATMPAFQTVLADGTPFTERDLSRGKPTALVFFRGRW